MKLHHKTPCADCPWRTDSLQGYLGGHSPEFYTDAVMNNEAPACHNRDHGPESDDTAFCAGALSTMANGCVSAWNATGEGEEARKEVGRRDDTFSHPAKFYEYHKGETWVHPFARRQEETA